MYGLVYLNECLIAWFWTSLDILLCRFVFKCILYVLSNDIRQFQVSFEWSWINIRRVRRIGWIRS